MDDFCRAVRLIQLMRAIGVASLDEMRSECVSARLDAHCRYPNEDGPRSN